MNRKSDVAICVLGKPYQTTLTLASLLSHSGDRIGRIFIQEEPDQPFGEIVKYLFLVFPGRDIVQFTPKIAIGRSFFDGNRFTRDSDYHDSVRYQRAWAYGPSDYLFITHNDCLFNSDVVGTMMEMMGETFIGAGQIGQCWNCPAHFARKCSGPIHEEFNPSYEQAIELVKSFPGPRTPEWSIQKDSPSPFPECRLNEFACLINKNAIRDRIMPFGPVEPFGAMTGDIGTSWFRKLRLEGYRFKDFRDGFVHAPFSRSGSGRPGSDSLALYAAQEQQAKSVLEERFPETLARLHRLRSATGRAVALPLEL